MLICLAAFLYFADSERSDVERCDMPIVSVPNTKLTVQTVATPQQVLHVLGHNSRDILKVLVQLVQLRAWASGLPALSE